MIFTFPITVRFRETRRASGTKTATFEGLASTWNADRQGTRIARGAFRRSLEALAAGKLTVPLLFEHDPLEQVGSVQTGEETDDGLYVTGTIVSGTPRADRVADLARVASLGLSIGFNPIEEAITVDQAGHLVFGELDWLELSAVSMASNRESKIFAIKQDRSLAEAMPADLERMLHAGELPPMPRRLAAKIAKAALPLIGAEPEEPEHDPADLAALAAALDGLARTFKR